MTTASRFKSTLLAAGSGLALLLSAPQVLAQCAPAAPAPGDTVTCAAGNYPTGIAFAVDALTVVVGNSSTPSTVTNAGGPGISLSSASGNMTLDVNNSSTVVYGAMGDGVILSGTGATINVNAYLEGRVTGAYNGVVISNLGAGVINLQLEDAYGGAGNGIYTYSDASTTGVTINATGNVEGSDSGLYIDHRGSGTASVTVNDVYGAGAFGVAVGTNTANIDIVATGKVTANQDAISAASGGGGDISVLTYGSVYSINGRAIRAESAGGNVSITSYGDLTGGTNAVYARSTGAGSVTIFVDDDVSSDSFAIGGFTEEGDISLTSNGTVSSSTSAAIALANQTSGNIYLSATNIYSAASNYGALYLNARGASGNIDASVSGTLTNMDGGALFSRNAGSGTTTIDLSSVYSRGQDGLMVGFTGIDVEGSGGNISITATGAVDAQGVGVSITQNGTGSLYGSFDDVNSLELGGITMTNAATATDLTLYAVGLVSAYLDGITIDQNGAGNVLVSAGTVTSTTGIGIRVDTAATAGSTTVSASGTVTAQGNAVQIGHLGSGNVSGTLGSLASSAGRGLYVLASSGNVDLTVTGTVNGFTDGAYVSHTGTGEVSLEVGGAVIANDSGLIVSAAAGDANLRSGNYVYSNENALTAISYSGGNAYVYAADAVSNSYTAVAAIAFDGDATIVSTGTAIAARAGLGASVETDGNVSITGVNSYTSGTLSMALLPYASVYAAARGGTGSITVNMLGLVTADNGHGIFGYHAGSGSISISAANITTTYADYSGVEITSAGGDVTVAVSGVINSVGHGVNMVHVGDGAIDISVNDVTSTMNSAVNVQTTTGYTNDVLISSSGAINTQGTFDAIYVDQNADGNITVNASSISTTDSDGINIDVYQDMTSDIGITVSGTITSARQGIYIDHNGTGAISVLTQDEIAASELGIQIRGANGDISVTAQDTVSGFSGIVATNQTGAVSVTATNVYATTSFGAGAGTNGPDDVWLTVSGTASSDGNVALLTVTGSGASGNQYLYGHDAYGSGYAMSLLYGSVLAVTDEDATGGNITVIMTGNVTNDRDNAAGISVLQQTVYGGNVTVSSNNVSNSGGSAAHGIYVLNAGGTTTVNSQGTVTAEGTGIFVNQDGSGFVDVTAASIIGLGSTALLIDTTDAVSDGISVSTTGIVLGDMIINVGDVNRTANPNDRAIVISNAFGGSEINISGDVVGSQFGVRATSTTGTEVTVASGASVDGGTAAIRLQGIVGDTLDLSGTLLGDALLLQGEDTVILRSGAAVDAAARIDLGTENDSAVILGAFAFDGGLRGGLGTDTLNFLGAPGVFDTSGFTASQFRQFEVINIFSSGWEISGSHFNYDEANFGPGTSTILSPGGRIFADTANISSSASLNMGNGSSFNRSIVQLDGTLDIGGAGTTGAASVLGTLNMGATGVINIDALGVGDNDLLRLTGNFANQGTINLDGNGTLNLNQTYALAPGQYTIINAVQSLSGEFATVNGLGSGGGLTQSLVYNNANNTVRVLTSATMMTAEDTGSKSAASAATYLIGQLGNTSEYAQLGFDVGTMASVAEIGDFASGITPDVLDSAVMVGDGAALRFGQSLAGCDINFSLNQAESCAAVAGRSGPAMFGEIRQTSANTGTEVGHNFNAQSFDMTVGMRLTDSDDRTQFGLMSGYAKSGSVSDALAGESRDGLEAESFSFGGYARRDAGWWSLDGTAMVSTSEAKLVRNITPGLGIAEQGRSEFVSRQFNLQGTATLNGLGESEFIIKPLATAGNRTLKRDGFTEGGAVLLGLTVDGQTRNVSYAGIGAEFAPDFTDEQGNGFRGMLRLTGLAYAGDTENDFTARFTNAPGESSFTYFGQNLDTSVLLEGGFQYIAGDGFAIGAEGFGEVNPQTGDSSSVGATLQLIRRW